jgi:hypothetical protein
MLCQAANKWKWGSITASLRQPVALFNFLASMFFRKHSETTVGPSFQLSIFRHQSEKSVYYSLIKYNRPCFECRWYHKLNATVAYQETRSSHIFVLWRGDVQGHQPNKWTLWNSHFCQFAERNYKLLANIILFIVAVAFLITYRRNTNTQKSLMKISYQQLRILYMYSNETLRFRRTGNN